MKQVNIQIPLRMLSLLLGLFLSASAFAQIEVKGHVKDATGEPIIGATVRVDGTQTATISDFDGNFALTANQGANISVSYVGFVTATVKAAPNLVITLKEDQTVLQDVVVIGYGTVRKSDATGSVMTVEADQLNKGLATSPADLLQGKTPGVQIMTNSGAPGAGSTIRIRGGSSLSASNDPLIVIDGLPISSTEISGGDVLNTINPNDIESFSILKDASATAIYGSRASNGVIIITTKKGKAGAKPHVNIDMTGSFKTIAKKVDVLGADSFKDFFVANYSGNADAMAALGNAKTDWQDKIYRTAWTEEINASVTGGYVKGSDFKMPYRVSAGFLNNDGILKTTNMNRGTFGVNLTPTLLDDHLTINLNGKGVFTHNSFADEGAIGSAIQYNPLKPVYNEDGNYHYWMNSGLPNSMATLNPVAQLEQQNKDSYVRRFVGNAQFDYKFKFLPGLRANLNLGLDYSTTTGWDITDYKSEISYHNKVQNGTGEWKKYTQMRRDQTLEFYLAYARELKELRSRFDILGGYSWQHFYNKKTERKLSNDGNNLEYAVKEPIFMTESYLVSFYGRLNWTLMDRYLLTATLRNDGTSRFQNNKWGLFPSVALAWRINEEAFLKDVDWLSNLKLRLGYGITGQQNINQGDYPSIPTYHTNQGGSYYWFGNSAIVPITPKGYAAQIKWEETTTYNVGLDFGFLKNRINGSVDVYKRKTNDLLNEVPVAAGTNLTNYLLQNVGDMENKGIEVAVNVVPIEKKNLRWEIGVNFAYNKNEITRLTASDDPSYLGVEVGDINGGVGNHIQIQQVGNPINSFYVFQQVYDEAGKPLEGVYVDRNHDGQITDNDRYVYYKPDADVNIGLNTELSYKKWTLSAAFRSSLGNYVYNNVASNTEMKADMWTNNFICNRVTTAPYSDFSQAQYRSDYYVQNASFLKLDKMTLAYNVCDWIRVHLTAQNVFTITNYKGVDPEVKDGLDKNMYPRSRNFIVGASFNF
ncbi:iron complex outermembrane recepter protein [Prevotella aff. ruminicola Tc2-24]|uniref:Iron complex outermembrane recepter protein n=1 Tax=Prevotella aff. ruminicola Tc2-24 TaxID=81582 RepID=A0A1I0QFN0_9BACT|nr:TonB-dependent receptor [Prevotella aff. ruminicola Tc2-24]SEW25713.1 iron complex outermembrane recepter protein [Prevotella aff. ruminicola Tc2-24]